MWSQVEAQGLTMGTGQDGSSSTGPLPMVMPHTLGWQDTKLGVLFQRERWIWANHTYDLHWVFPGTCVLTHAHVSTDAHTHAYTPEHT